MRLLSEAIAIAAGGMWLEKEAVERAIAIALSGFQAFIDIQQTFFQEVVNDCERVMGISLSLERTLPSAS